MKAYKKGVFGYIEYHVRSRQISKAGELVRRGQKAHN